MCLHQIVEKESFIRRTWKDFETSERLALARSLPVEFERRALGKDGQYRWFLIQYNPFRNERGQVMRRRERASRRLPSRWK